MGSEMCIRDSQGVPQSFERAVEFWRRAASRGLAEAQHALAQCHELGDSVAKDYLEARRLYSLSSAQGETQATEALNRLEQKIHTECPFLGKRVRITGTTREDLNGRAGVARSFDEAKGRYVVRLDGTGDSALRLKPGSLKSI